MAPTGRPQPTTPNPAPASNAQAINSILGGAPGVGTGNDGGITVDPSIVAKLGAQANTVIPGAQEMLGLGTGPLSLAALMTAFAQLGQDPTGSVSINGQNIQKSALLASIQGELALSGMYGKNYHPTFGVINPKDSDALQNAALQAGRGGGSLSTYLSQAADFGKATGFGPAGLGQLNAYHGVADITDPAQVRVTMDDVFQKLLGRKATESEKTAFIQTFGQQEHNAAQEKQGISIRAQKAYAAALSNANGTNGLNSISSTNPNRDFVDQANQADQLPPGAAPDLNAGLIGVGAPGADLLNPGGNKLSPTKPGATFSGTLPPGGPRKDAIDASHAQTFANQAAQLYGLTASSKGLGSDIGGPNGAAVQGVLAWAQQNMGPGKLFASVTQGTTGPNGPKVHVEFNATAGPNARQAITALGAVAPTTNDSNYADQRRSFVESLKLTPQGGNYTWAPNPQNGGYGAYGFSQSQWAMAAQAAGIPEKDWNNPTPGEQDAAANALVDKYHNQYSDWRTVATAFFAGEGVANGSQGNPGLLSSIRNGQSSAQEYVDNVMSRFSGPGGGQGNAADLSSQVSDVIQPNLQAQEILKAQTEHPAEYQATNMANQYDVFVNLLKGPGFTGRLPTG